MQRAVFDITMFLSLLICPWWLTAMLAIGGLFLFKQFYEFLFVFAILYALYCAPSDRLIASRIWVPIVISSIYIIVQSLRRSIIIYNNEI